VFGRRAKKETAELKEKYSELEGKYEHLSTDYEVLKEEAGEQTSMRISVIEEQLETMNSRVEKLATDSYEIHSELRDIKDSVTEMHMSLKEIVQLYKAILNRYGTPAIKEQQARALEAKRRAAAVQSGGDPGEAVLQQLMAESKQQRAPEAPAREAPTRRPPPPRPATASAAQQQQAPSQPAPPPPVPQPSAVDELQRAEAEDRADGNLDGDELARRMTQREGGGVDRAARRDMRRPTAIRPAGEDTFLDPLPKKTVYRRAPPERPPAEGWEETASPRPRPKPKLEDVLEPE
jgi:hypothetical protein